MGHFTQREAVVHSAAQSGPGSRQKISLEALTMPHTRVENWGIRPSWEIVSDARVGHGSCATPYRPRLREPFDTGGHSANSWSSAEEMSGEFR